MSFADKLTVLGMLLTVWLALIAISRAETRGALDRVLGQMDDIVESVARVWLMPTEMSDAQLKFEDARLAQAGDRLDFLVTRAVARVGRSCCPRIHVKVADIVHAATSNIEKRDGEPLEDRRDRCFKVHSATVQIASTLEEAFDRPALKMIWW